MVVPGGMLSYLGAFFSQHFYYPWIGVILLCGWWLLLMWLTEQAFNIPDKWKVLTLIPVAILLVPAIIRPLLCCVRICYASVIACLVYLMSIYKKMSRWVRCSGTILMDNHNLRIVFQHTNRTRGYRSVGSPQTSNNQKNCLMFLLSYE